MIWFVISIILLLFSAAVTGVALSNNVKGAGIGLIPGLVGLLLLIPACLYSVDVGEVAVIRNMGGSLAGHSEDAGFHWKTPWQSVIKYDTRNNLINFYKDTDYKYDGGSAVGKQVTVNDRSGASADIDIQVNYSLDPSAAEYLYSEYGKQQTFTQNYISNDLRSVAREQSGRFDTLTMLTNRGEYTKAVQDALAAKWRKIGLTVEQVSVQDVRYGEAITKKYTEAQAAEIDKQKALNEQQVAKTEAETKKIKAQGEADANAVLNESLTDNVLKQHYIDALSNADQLVVVPDGADDEEEDDGPDDAGELDELEHMRDVADMAYAALSDLALHCHNRREDVAWGIASSAAKDAHVLATFVGDWIEDMEDED